MKRKLATIMGNTRVGGGRELKESEENYQRGTERQVYFQMLKGSRKQSCGPLFITQEIMLNHRVSERQ